MIARVARATAVLLLAVLLAGCASAPPQRLNTIGPLVGKWQGTITVGMGARGVAHLWNKTNKPQSGNRPA